MRRRDVHVKSRRCNGDGCEYSTRRMAGHPALSLAFGTWTGGLGSSYDGAVGRSRGRYAFAAEKEDAGAVDVVVEVCLDIGSVGPGSTVGASGIGPELPVERPRSRGPRESEDECGRRRR